MAKVLLVEDDNNLREIFEMRLQAEGYETVTASNGEEALAVAMKEKPDLIVADIMMPKLSGFEMLETLRAAPEMKDTKVVMMTALGQAEDQARGEKLGVVKYLVKSQVTLEDFARVIKEILSPDGAAAGTASPASTPESTDKSSDNNKQESEKLMPEDTAPTNPASGGDTPPADANPISSGPGDSNQMTSSEEQSTVNSQIDSFVSGTDGTPSAEDSAAGVPTAGDGATPDTNNSVGQSDTPVSAPPADQGGGETPPAGDQPASPPTGV